MIRRLSGGPSGSSPLLSQTRTRWVGLVLAALVLAGCTGTPEPPLPVSTVSPSELARAKQEARIEDCPASDPDVAPVASGLPDLTLACLGGGREVRFAGLRGKPMMINVWAQWCEPCRAEAPYLAEVANNNDSDLMVLGVDFADPLPDWAIEFARLSTWRYPQLVDQDKVISGPLQLTAPPVTLLVRADGTIAYRHFGPYRSAQQIRDQVRQHLGVTL